MYAKENIEGENIYYKTPLNEVSSLFFPFALLYPKERIKKEIANKEYPQVCSIKDKAYMSPERQKRDGNYFPFSYGLLISNNSTYKVIILSKCFLFFLFFGGVLLFYLCSFITPYSYTWLFSFLKWGRGNGWCSFCSLFFSLYVFSSFLSFFLFD